VATRYARRTPARKALDLIASEDPHAVLLDLCLPDIDGVDVCREVRSWSTVPIIVLSASWEDHRKVERSTKVPTTT
jgi:two-component system KDP operon response regulator KdpE